MRMYDIIKKKRDGGTLTKEEIEFFISGYVSGDIPDYQASALLMAIYFRGMNVDETTCLTLAITNSGDKVELSGIKGFKADKHSTGGVGDKTTLIVAPIDEGRITVDGSTGYIAPSIGKLIKFLNCPVIKGITVGSYL